MAAFGDSRHLPGRTECRHPALNSRSSGFLESQDLAGSGCCGPVRSRIFERDCERAAAEDKKFNRTFFSQRLPWKCS